MRNSSFHWMRGGCLRIENGSRRFCRVTNSIRSDASMGCGSPCWFKPSHHGSLGDPPIDL
ncbi:hypothetical protein O9993_11875 [Vibrio lentus]|nr:hypothetical protein [Vibrio lentus]